ncbi:glycosyltransferase family 4 protein [Pseudooceanicola spongiae]|uniref:Glycosyltransferase n=1 Tax=Pseudooceanicola spongiae TaxID=2613965 RepID=A0A7L9WRM8_9RHOB|nr:glycosyltransferase family 1 protein [Pseudooceanicola spongiae]QOL82096.1 glycosyltransferase [Pseudooceanicola spongiae]
MDRVEAAYLSALLDDDVPLFGLARVALGYVLLDRAGLVALRARLTARAPWGPARGAFRLARRLSAAQQGAQADLWQQALQRCGRWRLRAMLRRLPAGTAYLNTGHSNLSGRVINAVRGITGARVCVFLHDTIPLAYPEFQRAGSVARFRAMLQVAQGADLILCNSEVTRRDLRQHMGAAVEIVSVPLGVERMVPVAAEIPEWLALTRPYFIVTGTIEPRKNHALLLDVWAALEAELPDDQMPVLLICGARGWRNEALFARLDQLKDRSAHVVELPGLSDGALAALTRGARASLFPSLAEGYGLPPAEAALLGTRPICSDLPVLREVLGEIAVYLNPGDTYAWKQLINDLLTNCVVSDEPEDNAIPGRRLPAWDDHFKIVLTIT